MSGRATPRRSAKPGARPAGETWTATTAQAPRLRTASARSPSLTAATGGRSRTVTQITNISPAALHLFSACAAVCTPACILWFDGTRDLNLCCELLVPCALLTSLLMRYAQAGEAGEKAVRPNRHRAPSQSFWCFYHKPVLENHRCCVWIQMRTLNNRVGFCRLLPPAPRVSVYEF